LENFRPRVVSASLVFGSVMHLALAEYFRQGHDPAASFEREWQALKGIEMRYSRKETWDFLHSPESHCSKHFTANTRRGSRALCWKTAGSDFGLDRMGRLMAQSAPKSWTLVRRRAP